MPTYVRSETKLTVKIGRETVSHEWSRPYSCREEWLNDFRSSMTSLIYKWADRSLTVHEREDIEDLLDITSSLATHALKDWIVVEVKVGGLSVNNVLVDEVRARYPNVKFEKDELFGGISTVSAVKVSGGLDAIAAAWWLMLISRLIANEVSGDTVSELLENSYGVYGCWYARIDMYDHTHLWNSDVKNEPPVEWWVTNSSGPNGAKHNEQYYSDSNNQIAVLAKRLRTLIEKYKEAK